MKNSFYSSVAIFAAFILLVFTSCESKQEITYVDTDTDTLLTTEQIDFIGDTHNQLLEQAFENFDYSNSKWREELEQQFSSLGITEMDADFNADADALEQQKADFLNQLSFSARNIVEEVIAESLVLEHVESFTNLVENKEALARRTLTGNDLTATLVFLNVTKKSAAFWASKEDGGTGVGFEIASKLHSTGPIKATPEWVTKALTADGISAAVGFVAAAVVVAATVTTGGIATAAIVTVLVSIAGQSGVNSAIAIGISTP